MQFPLFKLENQDTSVLLDPKSGEFVLNLANESELIQGQGFILNRVAGMSFNDPKVEIIFANPIIPLAPQMTFNAAYRVTE